MAEVASYLKRDFASHTRRVQDLFKRIVRNECSFYRDKADMKYQLAIIRAEFEKHRNVKDLRVAKMLMEEAEHKLFLHRHPAPIKFMWSPGGLMFEREHKFSDCHLDIWHPMEKAQYPYYFERREQLKKEYVEAWEKGNHATASVSQPAKDPNKPDKPRLLWSSETLK
ncbi:hypothetical protein RDWZM_006273 [Blomia tropicalis]|uniref:NADH dehydrogenase [ubiquinone] 1 beta subcomplex subunit 9 n=1 Tax=Blomia tropicalis TaxID=40697 RepID=A0A9Q0RN79_BLOTA|nr:hypothetical protein RDWZM_006273 [Blomia tropicalis]